MLRNFSKNTIKNSIPEPNCTSITDLELQKAIYSHWPVTDGKATIPYSISSKDAYWFSGYPLILYNYLIMGEPIIRNLNFSPIDLDTSQTNQLREILETSFNQWETASNNLVKFVETQHATSQTRGLHVYVADRNTMGLQATAFTLRRINNDGEISQVFMVLPNNEQLWNGQYPIMVPHETGHCLGFEHLQNYPDIQTKLENIYDGTFCSVMPYAKTIETNISSCHPSVEFNCDPSYAISPGPLDKRMTQLAYQNNLMNTTLDRRKMGDYELNVVGAFSTSFIISGTNKFATELLANIAYRPNEPFINKKIAQLVPDAGLFAALIFYEFPGWAVLTHVVSCMPKYLPDKVLDQSPHKMKFILTCSLGPFAVNFVSAFLNGSEFLPLTCTIASSLSGTSVGMIGGPFGRFTAYLLNYIPQKIVRKFSTKNDKPSTSADLEEVLLDKQEVNETADIKTPLLKNQIYDERPYSICRFFSRTVSNLKTKIFCEPTVELKKKPLER